MSVRSLPTPARLREPMSPLLEGCSIIRFHLMLEIERAIQFLIVGKCILFVHRFVLGLITLARRPVPEAVKVRTAEIVSLSLPVHCHGWQHPNGEGAGADSAAAETLGAHYSVFISTTSYLTPRQNTARCHGDSPISPQTSGLQEPSFLTVQWFLHFAQGCTYLSFPLT